MSFLVIEMEKHYNNAKRKWVKPECLTPFSGEEDKMWIWWLAGVSSLALVTLLLFYGRLRRFAEEIQSERARELFKLQQERLHFRFFDAAARSGKPRGLRWKSCEWELLQEFVRNRQTREIVALVGVTIYFEAIEGGDMEDVEAVGLPRNASAVFFFNRGHWHTTGQTLFNHNPEDALERYQDLYERLQPPSHQPRVK